MTGRLLSASEVAERIGRKRWQVWSLSRQHDIGQEVGRLGRGYTEADVERLRDIIATRPPGRPKRSA